MPRIVLPAGVAQLIRGYARGVRPWLPSAWCGELMPWDGEENPYDHIHERCEELRDEAMGF